MQQPDEKMAALRQFSLAGAVSALATPHPRPRQDEASHRLPLDHALLRRRLTPIGRTSLLTQTETNLSVPTFVIRLR